MKRKELNLSGVLRFAFCNRFAGWQDLTPYSSRHIEPKPLVCVAVATSAPVIRSVSLLSIQESTTLGHMEAHLDRHARVCDSMRLMQVSMILFTLLTSLGCSTIPTCPKTELEDRALLEIASKEIIARGGRYKPDEKGFTTRINRDECNYVVIVTVAVSPRPGDSVLIRIDSDGRVVSVSQGR